MGIESFIKDQLNNNESKNLRRWALQFVDIKKCKSCDGSRLKIESRSFKINNKDIFQLSEMDLSDLKVGLRILKSKLSDKEIRISDEIIKEILIRIQFLIDVGLEYLTLSRSSRSLSEVKLKGLGLPLKLDLNLLVYYTYWMNQVLACIKRII